MVREQAVAARRTERVVRHPRVLIGVLALGGVVSSAMQTLVLPLVPQFPHLLHTTPVGAGWATTVTLLAACVLTPVAGALGDRDGKRRMLLVLLVAMAAGSLLGAVSSSLAPMLVARALQGAAIGLVPIAISVIRDEVPERQRGSAIAFVSATLGFGAALSLPLAALVVEAFGYRLLFLAAAVLAVLVLVLVLVFVAPDPGRREGRFDVVGAVEFAAGLVGVLLAVADGRSWGWLSPGTLLSGIGGLVVLTLWARRELSVSHPLLDLRVASSRPVLLTNAGSLFLGVALFGSNVAIPQLLELQNQVPWGFGLTILQASLCLVPLGLFVVLMAPVASRSNARLGPRVTLALGGAVIVLAYVFAALFMQQVWQLAVVSALIGVGIGLGYSAMPTLIMAAVPRTQTAAANGLNTVARALGTTIAAAAVGVVLAAGTVEVGGTVAPDPGAFRAAFVIGAVAAALSVGLTLLVPRNQPAAAAADR